MKGLRFLACFLVLTACGRIPKSVGSDSNLQSDEVCERANPAFADVVVRAAGASGTAFGNPNNAVNGVRGAGSRAGSFDVFSLDRATDAELTVRWGARRVCNHSGPDFSVFENAFVDDRTSSVFFEPVIVAVSLDGTEFVEFPHSFSGDETQASIVQPRNWSGFAGMLPVLYNEENNNFTSQGIDPLKPESAGGDVFDLDSLPDTELGRQVKAEGFRFLRLSAAQERGFPISLNAFGGFGDIDGVYANAFLAD